MEQSFSVEQLLREYDSVLKIYTNSVEKKFSE